MFRSRICSRFHAPILLLCSVVAFTNSASAAVTVVYNQLGYLPTASKVIRVLSDVERPALSWVVKSGARAIKGQSSAFSFDAMASRWVSAIDLTALSKEGNVTLSVADQEHELVISESVYDGLLQQLLRSYYLQRCGVALDDRLSGLVHGACHLKDGLVSVDNTQDPTGKVYEAVGGWHDAGDYGKYVSTTAVVASQLLHLYERYPEVFVDRSHYIPESGNKIPDVVDETRVGLDWLLTVQRADGAFYRKLSGKSWPTLVPPEEDTQARYLFGAASDDSAKAVAALARGARVFADYDKSQAARYLQAALRGWHYVSSLDEFTIELHANDDKGSGPYRANKIDQDQGLSHHRDDLLAASAQLFFTTEEPKYLNAALRLAEDAEIALYEWKNPSLLAIVELLGGESMTRTPDLAIALRGRLLARAEEALQRSAISQFGLANHRIVWGSNKMTAAEGSLMLYAAPASGALQMTAAAQAQLDYLLGANPHEQTFVSGVGKTPVRHVSHIFARATGRDIPGLFVGGANEAAQAGKAPKGQGLMSYVDEAASYATNEYAIDYNSALIGLVVQLIAESKKRAQ